ncbi:ABC transporter related protein [Spirochaeta thermophila DSM 6578]|uniref:ABC transporter related protein n=1 Tax=Winmispira thermophila (strain ATCC 700085 / DSM 6578 / Z-1203) TaxID=869211 RepID=G0GEP3_WINT7|nr:ABC transporter ATP-binding protein [Spirochaeta thermophila]AEJ60731.1 ABC transporter related protein [Spirochaeta thermophila DSM 6578]
MRCVLELKDITRSYGSIDALDRLSLRVEEGEWLAIMGPSGAGKTTLLNILALLDTPTSGEYILDGRKTASLSEHERAVLRREKIGLVFQQFHLVPYLTALENVMVAQYYHSMADRREAEAVLRKVGLGERLSHRPSQLSGGEKQRVCIARALVNEPALLLADEPTGNLDERNEGIVLDLFRALKREGRTIIMVTHNPNLAKEADRIVYLNHGRISPVNPFVEEVVDARP